MVEIEEGGRERWRKNVLRDRRTQRRIGNEKAADGGGRTCE